MAKQRRSQHDSPNTDLEHLPASHALDLNSNSSLAALPESSGHLPTHHTLKLNNNSSLATLPEAYEHLPVPNTIGLDPRRVSLV